MQNPPSLAEPESSKEHGRKVKRIKPSQSKRGKGPFRESPVVSHHAEAFTGLGHLKGERENRDSGEFKAFSMH